MINKIKFFIYFNVRHFRDNTPLNVFPKIKKDLISIKRLDKISIFEYFDIIEERKKSKPQEYLIKEIVDFMNGNIFRQEFKYSLSNENRNLKFLLMNVGLVTNRLECILQEMKKDLNIRNIFKFEYSVYIILYRLIIFMKYIPLKFYCRDVLKFYIARNQIDDVYNHLIENEFFKKYSKMDFNYIKIKKEFINDLNKIDFDEDNSNENLEKFKEKYIKNFLLNDNFSIIKNKKEENINDPNENDCEKLLLYFLAHKPYLANLSLEDILIHKIYWGLYDIKKIDGNPNNENK